MVTGISGHNGWAVFVCLSARDGAPVIVDRGRIELLDPGLPNQPYEHDTKGLDARRADRLVREVRESALHCAERALARLRSSVGQMDAIAVRDPVLPHMPKSVAEAHASYHAMARADSMLFHEALCQAAASLRIAVEIVAKGKERARAAEALNIDVPRLEEWLARWRAALGAPWQKDHQDAAARAVAALGKRVKLALS